jgi:hypothetical protein
MMNIKIHKPMLSYAYSLFYFAILYGLKKIMAAKKRLARMRQ